MQSPHASCVVVPIEKSAEGRVLCFGFLVSGFGFQMSEASYWLKPDL